MAVLSAKCRQPLCGPPFPQVALDRRRQRYAFNQPTGMRSQAAMTPSLPQLVVTDSIMAPSLSRPLTCLSSTTAPSSLTNASLCLRRTRPRRDNSCTTATGGRTIQVHPHEDELRAARRRATTRSFQDSYRRWRPMAERSLAWLVADGCPRVPYRGIGCNDLWWSVRVAAVSLRRPAAAWPCPPRWRLGAGLR
jgi:Transposase DDE domain